MHNMPSNVPGTLKPIEMRDEIQGEIKSKLKMQPATVEEMYHNPSL